MASKSGSGGSQIVGYKYFMSIHMGLARGPIDELVQIKVGDDLVAWAGSQTTTGTQPINAPDLFGGDEKEGGLVGDFKLFMGDANQVVDQRYVDQIGHPLPGWRGIASLFYIGQICSNNPYPKPWKIRVRRSITGWDNDNPWYAERARIETGFQVIYQFFQNPLPGDQITINDYVIVFTSTPSTGPTEVHIGPDYQHTAGRLALAFANDPQSYPYVLGAYSDSDNGAPRVVVTMSRPSTATGIAERVSAAAAAGIVAMNGAHIIYECLTNNVWGRGLLPEMLDENSFITAADTLWNERLGLCLRWNRQDDIDKFVQTVIAHIGGALYVDRASGLVTLKLMRADYNADDLPIYTFENGILDVSEDQSAASDTAYNEIIVKWHDPITNKPGQVRVQNLASFQSLGTLISASVEYLGCPTADLALRLAQRDLEMNSSDVRRMTLKFNRAGWKIAPGSVFKISLPSRGIGTMIMRAGQITEGPLDEGTIDIQALQDIFGLPFSSFVTPQPPTWTTPDKVPWVIYERALLELTYFDMASVLPADQLASVTPDSGFTKIFAGQPKQNTVDYVVTSRTVGEGAFVDRSVAGFDATAVLKFDIGLYNESITFEDAKDLQQLRLGQPLLIGTEYCQLILINPEAGTATVARGCIDTHPMTHRAGERIWFQTAMPTTDFRDYSTGELIEVKLISRTTSQRLDPALAPTDLIQIAGRQGRPYPGANLKINGIPFETLQGAPGGDIEFTWSHRDRGTQGNFLLPYSEASTGPEAGTAYTWRVYEGSTLLRTVTGIVDDHWTYTTAMAIEDGSPTSLRFEFESVRGGLTSWLAHSFVVTLLPMRITESGDGRIAETGDLRITE